MTPALAHGTSRAKDAAKTISLRVLPPKRCSFSSCLRTLVHGTEFVLELQSGLALWTAARLRGLERTRNLRKRSRMIRVQALVGRERRREQLRRDDVRDGCVQFLRDVACPVQT